MTDLTSDKMWVNEGRDDNGGPVISISLTLPTRPSSSSSAPPASRPSGSSGSWVGKPSSSGQTLDGTEIGTAVQMPMHDVIDLERTPATIAQTGRDQLEVTVHPQSLTQTVNQEWGTEDTDDSDSDDDLAAAAAAGRDSNNSRFASQVPVSSDEHTGTEPEVEKSLMYHKLYPGRVIKPDDLASEQQRVAAILNNEFPGQLDEVAISGTRIQHEDGTVEFRVDDVAMASTSGSDSTADTGSQQPQEEDDRKPSWGTVVGNVLQVVQQLKQFAPEPGKSKEERDKHADLMQKLDEVCLTAPESFAVALKLTQQRALCVRQCASA